VMLDGRGHVRITDFGLAVSQDHGTRHGSAGTPAYMAPEQLAGAPASVQSDLYALGLTLYEIFTGKRAFAGSSTVQDLLARQKALDLTPPTAVVRDLDPGVERLITHCLDPEPDKRPRSASEVMNALPGDDPLIAAVFAGETPSPEIVAAAAERGDLSARAAWCALALFTIVLTTFAYLAPRTMLHERARIFKPTPILEERAREVLAATGHRLTATDSTYWYLAALSQTEWERTHPATGPELMPMRFGYRQSPTPMRSLTLEQRVDWSNPPLSLSGMAAVHLDSAGRLIELVVVPPQLEDPPARRQPVNWAPLIAMSGLPQGLRAVPPRWAAPIDSDEKNAWSTADGSVRVEAAAYHGRPVWFSVIRPWSLPDRMPPSQPKPLFVSDFALLAVLVIAWVAATVLGLRNLRRAQVDRRGALRVALFVFFTCWLALVLRAHHPGGAREFAIMGKVIAYALTLGLATWCGYVAIEPLVRRRWPRMLIGWSRLLAGQFRNAMIGRDLLLGLTVGIVVQFVLVLNAAIPGASPRLVAPSAFAHLSDTAHYVLRSLVGAAFLPLTLVTILLACLVVTRNVKAALIIGTIIMAAGALDSITGPQWIRIPSAFFVVILPMALLFRYGVLALAASTFAYLILMRVPITVDTADWYFGRSLFGLVLLAAIAMCAFVTSLGGKRFLPDIAVET
jgi:hypothetical protein